MAVISKALNKERKDRSERCDLLVIFPEKQGAEVQPASKRGADLQLAAKPGAEVQLVAHKFVLATVSPVFRAQFYGTLAR